MQVDFKLVVNRGNNATHSLKLTTVVVHEESELALGMQALPFLGCQRLQDVANLILQGNAQNAIFITPDNDIPGSAFFKSTLESRADFEVSGCHVLELNAVTLHDELHALRELVAQLLSVTLSILPNVCKTPIDRFERLQMLTSQCERASHEMLVAVMKCCMQLTSARRLPLCLIISRFDIFNSTCNQLLYTLSDLSLSTGALSLIGISNDIDIEQRLEKRTRSRLRAPLIFTDTNTLISDWSRTRLSNMLPFEVRLVVLCHLLSKSHIDKCSEAVTTAKTNSRLRLSAVLELAIAASLWQLKSQLIVAFETGLLTVQSMLEIKSIFDLTKPSDSIETRVMLVFRELSHVILLSSLSRISLTQCHGLRHLDTTKPNGSDPKLVPSLSAEHQTFVDLSCFAPLHSVLRSVSSTSWCIILGAMLLTKQAKPRFDRDLSDISHFYMQLHLSRNHARIEHSLSWNCLTFGSHHSCLYVQVW